MAIKTNLPDITPSRERYMRRIHLPSGGHGKLTQFFPEGALNVYPWDNRIDQWMVDQSQKATNKSNLLFSMIPQICQLNGCDVNNFIASEVALVVMVSRSILRKDEISYKEPCPNCSAVEEAKISIPDDLTKIGEKPADYPGYDVITLPEIKDVVKVKMLTIGDELTVMAADKHILVEYTGGRKVTELATDTEARIMAGIQTINDEKPDNIGELLGWLRAISPFDATYLTEQFELAQPKVSPKIEHVCDKCGTPFTKILALDADFFR